ncbi:MAG: glycosyltransferase family 2 protein [Desulfurococcales archaeon]|nr:glycosyltransferase family 2 protein [Desulfurococcales archaeon]
MYSAGREGMTGSERECIAPIVSIVIPTLNEAPNIEPLVSRLVTALEGSIGGCFEVIFVDDESIDGTPEVIMKLAEDDSRLRLLSRRGERGLASAILRGLREATGKYAVVMDADLQHPPEDVPRLLKALEEGADIVVASRYTRGGGVEGWSRVRLLMSLGATILAWILVPETRRTSDPMSGFFAINLERVKLPQTPPPGFKLLVEILRLNPKARVVDVPYVFRRRHEGRSKLGFKSMIDYLAHLAIASSPLRFALVGLGGTIVNLTVFRTLLGAGAPLDAAILLGFEAGLLFNFTIHDRITFSHRRYERSFPARLLGYHLSSAVGVGVGYLVSRSLITFIGLHPILSQLAGIAAGFIANYTLSSRKVWRGT